MAGKGLRYSRKTALNHFPAGTWWFPHPDNGRQSGKCDFLFSGINPARAAITARGNGMNECLRPAFSPFLLTPLGVRIKNI
ncbi:MULTISPECIES: hypothetical protein [unclassified Akkermansia]|uniref:hypothetical protein n=1 Tax=unclassified Akkermansia TaxID=2608915 RepID=UPI00122F557F|nr:MULTISPECIES: hypothetical protein [unclassified Akkermansia]KAA3176408.1 hypothetical protein F2A13_09040 [Akkermansia sp. BIOML-A59]KAA3223395.1 hypothetical protein F1965_08420 [Akkermansia sp. BIOML-A37]KAA3248547.1 hypothetical protein F1981_08050 [Akkermansia sp. BIOML-A27]KAA3267774.1 hypothetical protein F1943_07195 [Akkermansia sp. BIOML-A21]KAA3271749.1 hypothetical protein F1951_04280 [Akkermansia sp. BIOML-A19]